MRKRRVMQLLRDLAAKTVGLKLDLFNTGFGHGWIGK